MKNLILVTLFLTFIVPIQLKAGWEITGRIIDQEGNIIFKRFFIQDNVVKVEKYNLIYICNLSTEGIIIVDPENLVYTKTSLKAYRDKLRERKFNKLNELLELIPNDQKNEFENLFKAKAEQKIILSGYQDDSLTIRQMNDTLKYLGYETSKFNISANGRKLEEFLLTTEVDISKEIELKAFLQYVYLLEPEDNTVRYMASDKYLEVVKKGLVTRRFMYQDGFRTEWQVNKIDKKNIPAYEFGLPELCKEVNLDKWLNRKKDNDDNYYDDYE